jgi:hypothetical protein
VTCAAPTLADLYPDLASAFSQLQAAIEDGLTEINAGAPDAGRLIQITTVIVTAAQGAATAAAAIKDNPVPANLQEVIAQPSGVAQQISAITSATLTMVIEAATSGISNVESQLVTALHTLLCSGASSFLSLVFGSALPASQCAALTQKLDISVALQENSDALLGEVVGRPLHDAAAAMQAIKTANAANLQQLIVTATIKVIDAVVPIAEMSYAVNAAGNVTTTATQIVEAAAFFVDQVVAAPNVMIAYVQSFRMPSTKLTLQRKFLPSRQFALVLCSRSKVFPRRSSILKPLGRASAGVQQIISQKAKTIPYSKLL